ncbi:hypothetical protein PR202_gb20293 [Eleusine coracana subsp. coracana]|uniref:Uncharacterized protein n=1 Tax=Eleusine coracana subsp. coracana TaxID=191504 RepID=A0AAV5F858_ELECO|nr:hypothetical protein PR202_gb20293 [Eleusine coracana subsp. coracana]
MFFPLLRCSFSLTNPSCRPQQIRSPPRCRAMLLFHPEQQLTSCLRALFLLLSEQLPKWCRDLLQLLFEQQQNICHAAAPFFSSSPSSRLPHGDQVPSTPPQYPNVGLATPTAGAQKMPSLDVEHIGSLAAVVESLSPGNLLATLAQLCPKPKKEAFKSQYSSEEEDPKAKQKKKRHFNKDNNKGKGKTQDYKKKFSRKVLVGEWTSDNLSDESSSSSDEEVACLAMIKTTLP